MIDPATVILVAKLASELSELYQDHISTHAEDLKEVELIDMMAAKRKLQKLEDSVKGTKLETKANELAKLLKDADIDVD